MSNGKKATVQGIAREVGVSHPVVSRILNNKDSSIRISAKIKEAVLNEAIRQGFRLNSNIGVILSSDPGSPYAHEFLYGVFEKANSYGFGTYFAGFEGRMQIEIPWFLKERKVSGVVFLHRCHKKIRDFCDEEKIPYLIVNPVEEQPDHDCVLVDDYGIIKGLCEHLSSKGYQKYIYWTWNYGVNYVQERIRAFKDFTDENPDFHCETIFLGNHGENEEIVSKRYTKMRDLISREGPETVLISTASAFKLLEYRAWCHKKSPDDIGLACEKALGEFVLSGSTMFAPPIHELGGYAIDMMKMKWENQCQSQENVLVKGKILEVDSGSKIIFSKQL